MKHTVSTKSILLAVAAALTIASASAQTRTIYISGSTAFRSVANNAIRDYCTLNGGRITASNNSSFGSASRYVGTFSNSGSLHYISVAWSGSEGGIQSCAGPRSGPKAVNVSFWPTNASGTSSNGVVSAVTHITFSDTYQGTSSFNGRYMGNVYSPLTGVDSDGIIGVVPFCWVASRGCPVTNVTSIAAQYLIPSGNVPVALFTGNAADENKGVYLLGRNSDSGTRLATFGECGYGANELPQQYRYNSTTNIQLYPPETINGVYADIGNSGYSSGANIAVAMTNFLGAGPALMVDGSPSLYASNYLIGYSGITDANAHTNNGLMKLTYNGVDSSTNNIINGSYSFWTYQHLYWNTASANSIPLVETVARALTTSIRGLNTSQVLPNVGYNDMRVGRLGDGSSIYPNY
jgi:hypothetical protein